MNLKRCLLAFAAFILLLGGVVVFLVTRGPLVAPSGQHIVDKASGGNSSLPPDFSTSQSGAAASGEHTWQIGNSPTTAIAPAVTASAGQPPGPPRPVPVNIPLVFIQPDPSMGLDEAQWNAWQRIQDQFIASLGGENANPNDPAYHDKWVKAQDDLDEAFHAQFGDEAYNELLSKRHAAAMTAKPPTP